MSALDKRELSDEDRETLERLAESDRESAPIYQWCFERVREAEEDDE